MPGGMRVLDEDLEKAPDYQDALTRFVMANSDSPDALAQRSLDAPTSAPVPRPMAGPAAALQSMATGASPNRRIEGPTLTLGPGMSVGSYDVGDDQTPDPAEPPPAPPPSFLDRASRVAADVFTAPGLRQSMRGERVTDPTPLQRISGAVDDLANPLPDVSMPLPGAPPPAEMPAGLGRTVTVGRPAQLQVRNAADVRSHAPPTPSGDIPPASTGPASSSVPPDALARAREVLGPTPQRPDPLELALAASRNNRLVAGLTRAGGAAIGRGTGPGYDALDEGADRPLQEMGLREQASAKSKAEGLASGPLSPTEQSVYGRLLAQAGVDVSPEMLAKLPAGRVKALIPDLEKMAAMEATRGDKASSLKRDEARDSETARHNRATEALKARKGGAGGGASEKDVQKLGKDTEGLARIKADVQLLEKLATSAEGTDIPGAGVLDTRKPAFMQSQDDTDSYQATLRVAAELLHQQSGAAVTPSEAERFVESRGMGKGTTEQQFRTGAKALVRDLRAELAAKEAKYTPGTVETLRKRGGVTDLAPAANESKQITRTDPATGETRIWNGSAWVKP